MNMLKFIIVPFQANIWADVGLEFKPRVQSGCSKGAGKCNFCQKPILFKQLESRMRDDCSMPECPQLMAQTA